jgi:hypothetical protein
MVELCPLRLVRSLWWDFSADILCCDFEELRGYMFLTIRHNLGMEGNSCLVSTSACTASMIVGHRHMSLCYIVIPTVV